MAIEHRTGRTLTMTVPEDRLREACAVGDLETVKGLPLTSPWHMYRSGCMKAAINRGHMEIVLYLYEAYHIMHDKSTQFGIIPMCQKGRLDMQRESRNSSRNTRMYSMLNSSTMIINL